jgi:hypothetical protein
MWTNGQMDKWTNGQMDKWTNGQMDKWTNGQMDKWTNGQMDKGTNGQMDKWTNGQMEGSRCGSAVKWLKIEKINEIERTRVRSPPQATSLKKWTNGQMPWINGFVDGEPLWLSGKVME